jgi:hypothetical protein
MAVTATARTIRTGWPGVLAWGSWVLTVLALPVTARLDQLLRRAGLPELT